jgi:hypothetical protein
MTPREQRNKNKLRRYLRYHHTHTHPARPSHSSYISVLGIVEEHSEEELPGSYKVEEGWANIKAAMNKMSSEEIGEACYLIDRNKGEY